MSEIKGPAALYTRLRGENRTPHHYVVDADGFGFVEVASKEIAQEIAEALNARAEAHATAEELAVARKLGAAYRRMDRARRSGVEARMQRAAYAANLAEDEFAAYYATHPEALEAQS